MKYDREYFQVSADYLRSKLNGFEPELGLILGTGLGGVHMRDIVIGHTPAGAPCYVMNGAVREALERFDADSAFLSISHDGGIAAAFCVIARGEGGPCSDT